MFLNQPFKNFYCLCIAIFMLVSVLSSNHSFAASVSPYIPQQQADFKKYCYAYIDKPTERVEAIFDRMCKPTESFTILCTDSDGCTHVPGIYTQTATRAAGQVIKEKLNALFGIHQQPRETYCHFQSIKLLPSQVPGHLHILFVGGDIRTRTAHCMIATCTGNPITNIWRTISCTMINKKIPGKRASLDDETDLWHPAGIDICGNYLVLPLEDYLVRCKKLPRGRARIIFFDITDPCCPKRLAVHIDLPSSWCPCVACTRLADRRMLIAAYSGDIFISKSETIEDGFVRVGSMQKRAWPANTHQNLNFVTINKRLYLIGTRNSSALTPVISGKNYAMLCSFNFDTKRGLGESVCIRENLCDCGHRSCFCNFAAGATVTPAPGLLGISHWVSSHLGIPCAFLGAYPR